MSFEVTAGSLNLAVRLELSLQFAPCTMVHACAPWLYGYLGPTFTLHESISISKRFSATRTASAFVA